MTLPLHLMLARRLCNRKIAIARTALGLIDVIPLRALSLKVT
ncbi:hypothetical protein [Undibacterium umbellatum]|nr:hypothetical protein [Undibacterium umbellatum]